MRKSALVFGRDGIVLDIATAGVAADRPPGDPDRGTLDGSPLDDLPPHITLIDSKAG